MEKITKIKGRCIPAPGDDIDTDRIIPARFMKCVTFDGLGEYFFYDVRFDQDGNKTDHPLNDSKFEGSSILLSGNNFGCGSSREHAPQSLYRYGIRAVVAEGYAEIFFGNSTTLGIPCVTASKEDIATIRTIIEEDPQAELSVDIIDLKLTIKEQSFDCQIRDTARDALTSGQWDPLGNLLQAEPQVTAVAEKLPYIQATA
ncbi:MAG: 3-isopropylmalate dehydratase small subunit [Verrucomicrobiota bacterium]